MPYYFQGVEFHENPLLHFDQVGYRIGLHAVHAFAAIDVLLRRTRPSDVFLQMRDGGRRDVLFPLAWTGRTDYLPRSLRIRSVMQGRWLQNAGVPAITTATFTVTEPGGFGLLTALEALRNWGGWSEIQYVHWLLTVEFQGVVAGGHERFPRGARIEDIGRTIDDRRVFAWMMKIVKIDSNIDAAGATHEIHLTPVTDLPILNIENTLPYGVTLEGEVVAEFLDQLMGRLNKMIEEHNLATGQELPIREYTYRIHTLPKDHPAYGFLSGLAGASAIDSPSDWMVTRLSSTDPKRQLSASRTNPNATVVAAARGDSIVQLITDIIRSTREHQNLETGGAASASTATTANSAAPWKMEYRVAMTVELIDEPSVRTHPRYRFVYHLVPYVTSSIVSSAVQLDALLNQSPSSAISVMRTLSEMNALRKIYAHMYTGLNTEVLEADMNWNLLNNYIFHTRTPLDGGTNSPGSGTKIDPLLQALIADQAGWVDTLPFLVRAMSKLTLMKLAAQPVPMTSKTPSQTQAGQAHSGLHHALSAASQNSVSPNYSRTAPKGSAVSGRRGGAVSAYEYGRWLASGNSIDKVDWAWPTARLVIRGDPYWLPAETPGEIRWSPDVTDGPQALFGETMFLWLFHVPRPQTTAGSVVTLLPEDRIGGLYTVTVVTHEFEEDGTFRQILEGARSPALVHIPGTAGELGFEP